MGQIGKVIMVANISYCFAKGRGNVKDHWLKWVSVFSVICSIVSVERATPGEEVLGSIPTLVTRCLLVGSVSV